MVAARGGGRFGKLKDFVLSAGKTYLLTHLLGEPASPTDGWPSRRQAVSAPRLRRTLLTALLDSVPHAVWQAVIRFRPFDLERVVHPGRRQSSRTRPTSRVRSCLAS